MSDAAVHRLHLTGLFLTDVTGEGSKIHEKKKEK